MTALAVLVSVLDVRTTTAAERERDAKIDVLTDQVGKLTEQGTALRGQLADANRKIDASSSAQLDTGGKIAGIGATLQVVANRIGDDMLRDMAATLLKIADNTRRPQHFTADVTENLPTSDSAKH